MDLTKTIYRIVDTANFLQGLKRVMYINHLKVNFYQVRIGGVGSMVISSVFP